MTARAATPRATRRPRLPAAAPLQAPAVATPVAAAPATGGCGAWAGPPRFLFVQANQRCNLRCGHCAFWRRDDKDRANYLSAARQREIFEEFAQLNPRGGVVICGGEPMLDLEEYFFMARECRRLGLKGISVVNGTRIRSAATAERMIAEGPHEISISLNSHDPEVHDRTRGVKGAFDKAVRALRLLLEARRKAPGSTTRIYVMGLIFDENWRDLEVFYDFVLNDLGADKLKLNFLQPSFGEDGEVDAFFRDRHGVDPDGVVAVIARCDERFGLGLNPVWLGQVGMYFRSLARARDLDRGWRAGAATEEHICDTYERNIMVDQYGFARLCFSGVYRGERLEAPGDLRRFWYGAGDVRAAMRGCNRVCGISHSVRREASTLAGELEKRWALLAAPGG
ncbi:MAG: radical SAM protein [Rhodospirillales bacterium]|nr:MAG: radical SAM protein [Rhodospirillales bacterium]